MASPPANDSHQTRRQRRAAASQTLPHDKSSTDTGAAPDDTADFKLAQPDRSGPKGKSLLDIAAERQAALTGRPASSLAAEHIAFPPRTTTTTAAQRATFAGDDVPPWATALLYALTLTIVHLTLDVAVYHQYAQEIEWAPIARRIGTVAPSFAGIVYTLHHPAVKRFPRARQGVFLVFACVAGAYLVRAGNTQTYIAVMRRVPPLGTLLIWGFVEMELGVGVLALGVTAGYVWWNGFSVA